MATGVYIGDSSGKSRKVKKIYVGIDRAARQIKKAYVGDTNGKARLCYTAIELISFIISYFMMDREVKKTYTCEKGMTFGEFVNSIYNDGKFAVVNGTIEYDLDFVYDKNDLEVLQSDVIQSGEKYMLFL